VAIKIVFLYFAYGSNMFYRRLLERAPSADQVKTGFVAGRRLTFDKLSCDGSGKCNIEITNNQSDRVYGVLYEIDKLEEKPLNKAEGVGEEDKDYKEKIVEVVTSAGTHRAVAYVVMPMKKKPGPRPYHWYKAIVIAGAVEHALPASYVEWLRTIESKPDPSACPHALDSFQHGIRWNRRHG